jgi:DNA (cytosine-5)-methyltransferase 1
MATFAHNFHDAQSLRLDLSKTPPAEFMSRLGITPGELTLLAGGPPCQGFSKNVPRKQRFLDSANNKLVKTFLDYCESLKPKLILMENVAEMKNGFAETYTAEILSRLKEEGYTVTPGVLNAADFGVPQRRRRAFFIASRDEIKLEFPRPTHSPLSDESFLFSSPRHVSVWDAIGDLPSLKHGEGKPVCVYASEPFSDFQRLMRNGSKTVSNHIARRLQPTQYERLASLLPGQGLKDLPQHLRPKSGYSGAYARLTKDMVAPTITRWVFHPGSGRFGHPVDIRVLTIREAARIQGFPDSFEFVGTYTQQAGQVGNAVPPLLAERIAESLLQHIQLSRRARSSMNFSKPILSAAVGNLKVTA